MSAAKHPNRFYYSYSFILSVSIIPFTSGVHIALKPFSLSILCVICAYLCMCLHTFTHNFHRFRLFPLTDFLLGHICLIKLCRRRKASISWTNISLLGKQALSTLIVIIFAGVCVCLRLTGGWLASIAIAFQRWFVIVAVRVFYR